MISSRSSGEVTTRLIVALAIVGVIAIAAVPLGFFIWPALSEVFWPEKLELVFEETFENYTESDDRRIFLLNWIDDEYNAISGEKACKGKKCIKLLGDRIEFSSTTGCDGDTFAALVDMHYPFIVEFDLLITGPPVYAKDPIRARIFYGPKGWVHGSVGISLCDFTANGQVRIGDKSVMESGWKKDKWHHVRLRCNQNKISVTIDGCEPVMAEQNMLDKESWKDKVEIVFEGHNGASYFDNIRIYRVVKK
ncbi:MAG: hypothetical protein ACYS8W_15000 [Planctomycetota bacterium]|jgi:hypothetical protein